MSIPKDTSPAIDSGKGSNDTNVKAEETATTNEASKDSKGFTVTPVEKPEDTQKDPLAELTNQVAELNRKTSDKERRQFEAWRKTASINPDKILEYYEEDPTKADAVVKSLWADKGFNNVEDLMLAAKEQEVESKIEDPEVLKMKRENDELKKRFSSLEDNLTKKSEQEALSEIYSKYPVLHPSNDSNDENWKKFKSEFDAFSDKLPVFDRAERAYKLAFGDIDEDETRELQKSLGSLPSGGKTMSSKSFKISEEARRAEELSGVPAETIEKYKDYFNK